MLASTCESKLKSPSSLFISITNALHIFDTFRISIPKTCHKNSRWYLNEIDFYSWVEKQASYQIIIICQTCLPRPCRGTKLTQRLQSNGREEIFSESPCALAHSFQIRLHKFSGRKLINLNMCPFFLAFHPFNYLHVRVTVSYTTPFPHTHTQTSVKASCR